MDADVALLQEAGSLPDALPAGVAAGPHEPWQPWPPGLYDRWPRVLKLSDRVDVAWFRNVFPVSEVGADEFAVSGIGTVSAARVRGVGIEPFTAVSMYARWMRPHPAAQSRWRVGAQDVSAHRILSDLSAFIGSTDPARHRILAAGDLNSVLGSSGEFGPRDRSIFARFDALGLELVGPQHPNGRQASPRPDYLPAGTGNVPTYAHLGKNLPGAHLQLDYVFASRGFHEAVTARALNEVAEWGASDHCRVLIEVGG